VVEVLYLATASTSQIRQAMQAGVLGQMVTPHSGNRLEEDVPCALDNGCFSDRWKEVTWRRALARYAETDGCLFAVVPDVVANAAATDDLWARWAPVVHEHGYRAAYFLQNVCTAVPPDADAVFTGGDISERSSAGRSCEQHVGGLFADPGASTVTSGAHPGGPT
jgi:hypothetical protein